MVLVLIPYPLLYKHIDGGTRRHLTDGYPRMVGGRRLRAEDRGKMRLYYDARLSSMLRRW